MNEPIRQRILALLQRKGGLPPGFTDDTDYIDEGIVDSLAIVKFIVDLEKAFDIELTDEDIESPAFRTVAGLTALVGGKRPNAPL
ncbi:acyl carrier protein [Massilia sp. METH4]|uniref:acyl carrier protein n=1 Tax=Massilia sp. METH4 TaxID=3123041 RepID=UPI0030D50FD1